MVLLFLPPLLLPPLVKMSVGEEESRHTFAWPPREPGCRYGGSPGHGQETLKCTLKEPCGSSKRICHGQPDSLQVPESFTAGIFRLSWTAKGQPVRIACIMYAEGQSEGDCRFELPAMKGLKKQPAPCRRD